MHLFQKISERQIFQEILRHERCAGYVTDILNEDLSEMDSKPFTNFDPEYKYFTGIRNKNPGETVAKVNKALLRERLINKIKERVFQKNLPYIHLAYYPKGYRNIASFRVDCDKSNQAQINYVLRHASEHLFPITWFIEVAAQENFLKDIAEIVKDGHDVQLHCYKHITFKTYRENKQNIVKGRDMMKAAGINVKGFASPFGQWNSSLNQVLEDLNFLFSSEFGIGYDDLPFFPVFNNKISKVLQVPVHPICIGSLRDKRVEPYEMVEYFDRIIQQKFTRNSPIILYGHPRNELDNFPEVMDFILSTLKNLPDVWIATFSEITNWWLTRLSSEFTVGFIGDEIEIISQNTDPKLQIHIEMSNSTEAYIPLMKGRILMKDISWQKKKEHYSNPTLELIDF